MKFKLFFTFVLIFLISIFFSSKAFAKTRIEEKADCQYEIKVKMVFDFKTPKAQDLADSLLAEWQNGMNQVWHAYKNEKCQAKFIFTLDKIPGGKTCNDFPSAHCYQVVETDRNQRGNISDSTLSVPNSNQNSQGEWTIYTTGLNAAHEAGHMMGLGDEYHYKKINKQLFWVANYISKNGWQSIMAQTWDKATSSQEQVLNVLKQAGYTKF
ncbi:MAG: hypothetical protein WC460_02690 [Patescibacteria group bacterium]